MPAPTATQVRRPWRATVRTIFQFVLAAAVLLPFVVEASGLDPEIYPWLAALLGVAAAVTRVMALPQVEAFLARFAPWLAADPDGGPARQARAAAIAQRNEHGRIDIEPGSILAVTLGILLAAGIIELLELLL